MKLKDLQKKIDAFLDANTEYIAFKIGKTKDIEERKEYYLINGYQYVWHLLNGSPKDISNAEILLEEYFMNNSPHKNKCKNERKGGGSKEADKIYIALMKKNYTINDVCLDETEIDKDFPTNIEI